MIMGMGILKRITRFGLIVGLALFSLSQSNDINARSRGITSSNGVVAPMVPVGSRAAFSLVVIPNTNNFTQFQNRTAHTINAAGTFNNLVLRFANYSTNGGIITGPSALTLIVGVKMASGSFYRCYWPGNAVSITLQPSDVADCQVSIPSVNQGERFLINRWGTYASAPTNFPGSSTVAFAGDEPSEWGNSLTDKTVFGAFNGTVTSSSILPPIAIMSRWVGVPGPSVAIDGDGMISLGQDDSGETIPASTSGVRVAGYAQRALQASSIPFTDLGTTGETKASIASPTSINLKFGALAGCGYTHLFEGAGSSDISGSPGSSSATIYAVDQSITTQIAAFGLKHIPITIGPRTDVTNTTNYPSDAASVWVQRLDYNANKIRANNGTGAGYYDLGLLFQDTTNQNLWLTNPNTDGVHPDANHHTQAKTDLMVKISAGLFNFLLKRDIDPTSNDNSPMWLEKVA